MTREVKVKLSNDVAEYIAPTEAATEVTEKLDDKVDTLNRDLDKVPAASARAAAAMKLLGGEADGVRGKLNDLGPEATTSLELVDKQIEKLRASLGSGGLPSDLERLVAQFNAVNDSSNKTITFSKFLSTQLESQRQVVKDLGTELKKTGDVDVFAKLKSATADLKTLEGIGKDISNAVDLGIETGGKEGAKSLGASIQGVLSTPVLGPITSGALIAGAIAAAPVIGATVGAAVISAGGLGLIGAGIAGQFKSPMVQAALNSLEVEATGTFKAATSAFGPVLVDGVHQAEAEVVKLRPQLLDIFTTLAPVADKIFGGTVGFIDKLTPGLDALAHAAGPVLGELATELPAVGSALTSMLESISAGGPGAALALHDVLEVIDGLIVGTGKVVEGLSKTYAVLRLIGSGPVNAQQFGAAMAGMSSNSDEFTRAVGQVPGAVQAAINSAQTAAPDFDALAKSLGSTAETADTLAGKMSDKIFNSLLAGDQATLGWYESLNKVTDSLKENGRTLDITKEKGEANREAILSAVSANVQQYDANIASGMSATQAADAYDANTQALDRQLRKAGLTQAQIDGLIGKYKSVPSKVDTNIAIQGLTDAINNLADLERQINHIPSTKTVNVVYKQTTTTPGGGHGSVGYYATGGLRRAAVGMFIPPSDPGTILTGEPQTGGEMLTPLQGISQSRAMAQTRVIGDAYGFDVTPRGRFVGGGGSGTFRHEFVFAGGGTDLERTASDAFMGLLRKGRIQIRTTG